MEKERPCSCMTTAWFLGWPIGSKSFVAKSSCAQSILKNAPDLPVEYRRANKEQVRQRLELARWNLDDLLEDIEDGIVARELKRIYNEYCGGGDDGEV